MARMFVGEYNELQATNIGMFLRKAYYLRKKEVRCCGMVIQSSESNDVNIATVLDWGQTVYSILTKVNKSRYGMKSDLEELRIGERSLKGGVTVERLSEEIYSVEIPFDKGEITTNILSGVFDVYNEQVVYKSMADNAGPDTQVGAFKLILLFIYGSGSYDDETIRGMLEITNVFVMPVDCTCPGNFMFKVEGSSQRSKLYLEWNDRSDSVRDILVDTLKALLSAIEGGDIDEN